ncbi:MAG: DNA-binding response regulator [Chloroflexi bacterium]|nr:MAG: DNA-binding response regulator [Chloroflexota bacterium]
MTTILVIEDAIELAQTIRREFEGLGYTTLHAVDGVAGMQLFQQTEPDLVILDWMLPKLDGVSVLAQIRAQSAVPVLMLTARGEEADRVIGLELGADDYLTKPFSMRELVARVRALLRRIENVNKILAEDRAQSRSSLNYKGLCLEPEAYEATLNNQHLELTRTEFDLLALLLRNPGRAFSRTYLLDTVWGESYVTGDRSVDNAVLRLRKKLRPLDNAVETVWGVGYRLAKDEG